MVELLKNKTLKQNQEMTRTMKPLYITVDPVEYLTPGQEGARARVKIKHDARDRAEREGFDSITIVDCRDNLIEEVSTSKNIADKRYCIGYDVMVKTTEPGLSSDHPANLDRADHHGTVVVSTNRTLTIHVLTATRLDKLRRDHHFQIIDFAIVRSADLNCSAPN